MKKRSCQSYFLVNLDEDISEEKNVTEETPEKLNKLLQLHKDWLKSVQKELNK
nr:hypothetical protein [uncultured Allomuricauda sp.]